MTPSPALLRAYRLTVYRVGDETVRIGHRSTLTGVLITAWNPRSRRMPEAWNRRMQDRLRLSLRRWPIHEASGGLGRWREDHLLVAADPRLCRVLARRFRQHALLRLIRT